MEIQELVNEIGAMKVKDLVALTKALEATFHLKVINQIVNPIKQHIEEVQEVQEQTSFSLILEGYGDNKVAVIKVVRELFGLGLKEAMDLVNKAPVTLKEDIEKVQAQGFVDSLTKVGASVRMQ